jgi:REP element-mobilizing transposase RayT
MRAKGNHNMAIESKSRTSSLQTQSIPTPKPGHQSLRRGRISLPGQIYNITSTTVFRTPVFADFQAGCAAARCFGNPRLLGDARMLAWVLMPDHAHWLIQIGDINDLATVVNRLKSASARQTNRALGRTETLWQRAYHDHALRADEDIVTVARYIVTNPIRAGLVQRAGDYPFWNAIWV